MRAWLLSVIFIITFCAPLPAVEFKNLLVGDAMPGWEEKFEPDKPPAQPTWDIKEGVLHCNGKGGGAWWGSKKDYTDFILDFEFKLPPAGNSGVYIRAPRPGEHIPRATPPADASPTEADLYTWHPTFAGMEIQVLDDPDPAYKNIKIWQHCGSIYHIAPAQKEALKKTGEWNRMRITAEADHITVELNGETIVDADGQSHPEILQRKKSGPLGFQHHSSDLWFRNIKLADLTVDRAERTKWFRDAKFGMFIHWGVYSVIGEGEWIMKVRKIKAADYEKLPAQFTASEYDPKAWAALAKRAGCKYVVITSKHHDGFAMFDTQAGPYNAVERSAYAKDPMKPLADAVRAEGMRFGFYHSILDWHHPDYAPVPDWDTEARASHKPDFDKYLEYLQTQVRELCTNYGPLACIWWDGSWDHNNAEDKRKFAKINSMVRELQPQIMINNRANLPEDFDTPEQYIPPTGITNADGTPKLWENCITLTTGHGSHAPSAWWGYDKNEKEFKTPEYCIRMLVDIVSKGGNLLLNVGPDPQGRIGPNETKTLEAIGKWLELNGESIYGTTASPFRYLPFYGRVTVKGDKLYVHVFSWPSDHKIALPGLRNEIKSAHLLTSSQSVEARRTSKGAIVALPPPAPDPIASVIVLQLADSPAVDPVVVLPEPDGSFNLEAFTAELHGQHGQQIRIDPVTGIAPPDWVCITNWTNLKDYVTWEFEVPREAKYVLELRYAGVAGGTFEVNAGAARLKGDVQSTATDEIRTVRIGEIELHPGRNTLEIKPTKTAKDRSLMDLLSARLTPVDKK